MHSQRQVECGQHVCAWGHSVELWLLELGSSSAGAGTQTAKLGSSRGSPSMGLYSAYRPFLCAAEAGGGIVHPHPIAPSRPSCLKSTRTCMLAGVVNTMGARILKSSDVSEVAVGDLATSSACV